MTSLSRDLTLRTIVASGGALVMTVLLVVAALGDVVPSPGLSSAGANNAPVRLVMPAPPQVTSTTPSTPQLLEGESRTAIQGDEISNAVATYGIDGSGNLYEVHSPQTEVPKLGRPTT